jgi:RNA polymerase sigma factor (TIGR02999 family)
MARTNKLPCFVSLKKLMDSACIIGSNHKQDIGSRSDCAPWRLTEFPRTGAALSMNEVTQLLDAVSRGEALAAERLLPLVYEELRRLAAGYLDHEKPGQTLQPTALVHEAYLRMVGGDADAHWHGRAHFVATAALAMRHILIDSARRKRRDKHGGELARVELADHADPRQEEADRLLALDEALTRLAAADATAAELVQLHTFGGWSVEEAGKHLGLSRAAAYRQWAFARAWLRCELAEVDEKS